MFDGSDDITITLKASEWNLIIAALLVYRPAASLAQQIGEQARLQDRSVANASD